MTFALRSIRPEEFPTFCRTAEASFGATPTADEVERWQTLTEIDRTIAVFDGDEMIGTTGAESMVLSLPGRRTVPAAGVTAVAVKSTHRRRGVLRTMMEHQLDDVAARGESIAVLTASESIIYGRFGYGLAASTWTWVLPTQGTRLAWPSVASGRLRLVDGPTAGEVVPRIYEQACLRHPGAVSRSAMYWTLWAQGRELSVEDRPGSSGRFQVIHDAENGEPDGFASWRILKAKDDTGLPTGQVHVEDLYAVDDEVEAALWEHILAMDLMRTVYGRGRPVEEPLRWRLADPRRLHVRQHADHLWLRVLDPAVALPSREYAVEGSVAFELHDPIRSSNDCTWILEANRDGASCRRTQVKPDLRLGVSELGALLLGGVSATTLNRAGRLDEVSSGAVRRADALFSWPVIPWCGTDF